MKSIINSTIVLAIFVGLVVVSASSCKQPAAPLAQITVLDTADNRVDGATVILSCRPIERTTCNLGDTAETNSDGVSEHEVAYQSVLQVYAYKEFTQGTFTGMMSGETYIKMEPGETVKETVVISID